MRKATFAAILAMFTLYSAAVPALAADGKTETAPVYINDCGPEDWYAPAVRYVVSRSLMDCVSGASGQYSFSPKTVIQRQEVAETLYRTFKLSDNGTAEGLLGKEAENFGDFAAVSNDFRNGVKFCVSSGIMLGDNKGLLNPKSTITREEYAVMLSRFLEVLQKYELVDDVTPADGSETKGFSDRTGISGWAEAAVSICIRNELMNGVSGTIFYPKGTVTRAQMAQVIYNITPDEIKNQE